MQNTIQKKVSISGIALHTGVRVNIMLCPAPVDTGVVFRRVDIPGCPTVRAVAENVIDVRRATTIASRTTGAFVITVEHILQALHASHIDNVFVEMDNGEPPILDGSAGPFFDLIQSAGILEQDKPASIWKATSPIVFNAGNVSIELSPCDHLEISMNVDFGVSELDKQTFTLKITPESFRNELSEARTFCAYRELEQVIAAGLVKGGSLDNAIILHDGALISRDGLRYPNELVRHKIMDMVGDLYLTGKRVHARISATKSGHPTHVQLVKMMLEHSEKKENFE